LLGSLVKVKTTGFRVTIELVPKTIVPRPSSTSASPSQTTATAREPVIPFFKHNLLQLVLNSNESTLQLIVLFGDF
jgi:hypothetical protein